MNSRASRGRNFMSGGKTTWVGRFVLITIGLLLGLVLIEFGMRAAGWMFFQLQAKSNRFPRNGSADRVILCLGESTTALGGDDSYPSQLERILADRFPSLRIKVINKGIPGTNTTVILDKLEENIRCYRPDIVIAMMGINDERRDRLAIVSGKSTGFGAFINNLRVVKLFQWLRARLGKHRTPGLIPEGDSQEQNLALPDILETAGNQSDPAGFLIEKAAERRRNGKLELAGLLLEQARSDAQERARFWFEKDLLLLDKGNVLEAGVARKKGIEIDPEEGYNHLFTVSKKLGLMELWGKKLEVLEEAIKLRPGYAKGYIALAEYLRRQRHLEAAEKMIEIALKIEPDSPGALKEMGMILQLEGDADDALDYYRRAYEVAPFSSIYPYVLGLLKEDRAEEAEAIALKTLRVYPENPALLRLMAACCTARQRITEAEEYSAAAAEKESPRVTPETVRNFRCLRNVLAREGIRLVCVQYPMRPLSGLKTIFWNKANGVIFVDNEASFREAVSRHGFDHCFQDQFGGDFGHATAAGNRLLAENVAAAVEDLFK